MAAQILEKPYRKWESALFDERQCVGSRNRLSTVASDSNGLTQVSFPVNLKSHVPPPASE